MSGLVWQSGSTTLLKKTRQSCSDDCLGGATYSLVWRLCILPGEVDLSLLEVKQHGNWHRGSPR